MIYINNGINDTFMSSQRYNQMHADTWGGHMLDLFLPITCEIAEVHSDAKTSISRGLSGERHRAASHILGRAPWGQPNL